MPIENEDSLQPDRTKRKPVPKGWRRTLRFTIVIALSLAVLPVIQVACLTFISPPSTVPMMIRWTGNKFSRAVPSPNEYHWLPLKQIPREFLASVWMAEDQKFFTHHGFDWEQIAKARKEATTSGKPVRGASTITQQCARSLFLWQKRSWIRKGLEAYYTVLMELMLSKGRILEVYANVIELGDGVYGIEAGAQHYYLKPASQLNREQLAMLTAIMPNPRIYDPLNPTERVLKRQARIVNSTENADWSWEIINLTK
jgi:monofunctional biosynthetic peptidoglycan transglycosylase